MSTVNALVTGFLAYVLLMSGLGVRSATACQCGVEDDCGLTICFRDWAVPRQCKDKATPLKRFKEQAGGTLLKGDTDCGDVYGWGTDDCTKLETEDCGGNIPVQPS